MKHKGFAALILTHGRPDKVYTYKTLRAGGYTGRIVIVIDDGDPQAEEYRKRFKGEVVVFNKAEAAKLVDAGDNFGERRGVVYARNACWKIAKSLCLQTFIMLDDDYTDFRHKRDDHARYVGLKYVKDLDRVFDAMLAFYLKTPALSIAMAQGGDFIGGENSKTWMRPNRKVMNSFFCATDRPFKFYGSINEDVTCYVNLGVRGALFLTVTSVAIQQKQTQKNSGGLTEFYLDIGTYVKSFYSVIFQPSRVKVSMLRDREARIHHRVAWRNAAPCILAERHKRGRR